MNLYMYRGNYRQFRFKVRDSVSGSLVSLDNFFDRFRFTVKHNPDDADSDLIFQLTDTDDSVFHTGVTGEVIVVVQTGSVTEDLLGTYYYELDWLDMQVSKAFILSHGQLYILPNSRRDY